MVYLGLSIPNEWTVVPVKNFGMFLVKDNEIHAYRLDEAAGKWLTRQTLENLTKPLFKQYGKITTRVRKHNLCGHRFVQRLGFHEVGEQDGNTLYEAERLKHARL